MLIATLILIILSNVSFVGYNIKRSRDKEKFQEKQLKLARYRAREAIKKSVTEYAEKADSMKIDVTLMNAHLPTILAEKRQI